MSNNKFYMANVETLREFCKFHLETFARVIEHDLGAMTVIPAKDCYDNDAKVKDPTVWLIMRDMAGRVYFLSNNERAMNQVEMHFSDGGFYFKVVESGVYKDSIKAIMPDKMITADEWIDEFNSSIAAVMDPTRIIIAYYIIGG